MPGGWKNSDNYDRALRKTVTDTEYSQIIDAAENYIDIYTNSTGDGIDINEYMKNTDGAAYNLYNHNCDTVAGKILGLIDENFVSCQNDMINTTPNNSYYVRKVLLGDEWEEIEIGENSLWEKTIGTEGLYYMLFTATNKLIKECELE